MSGKRKPIRFALGKDDARLEVRIYRSRKAMRRAARRFNGHGFGADTIACCQATWHPGGDGLTVPILRFDRHRLELHVVAHEVSHAATGIYGSMSDVAEPPGWALTHYNETLAHLHSDLLSALAGELRKRRLIKW